MRGSVLLVVAYLVLWQVLYEASSAFGVVAGFRPWFPPVALDVLLLIAVGWRWWPMLPVAAAIHSIYAVHSLGAQAATVATHLISGLTYGVGARFLREGARVRLPLRTTRDIGFFCVIFVLAAPIVSGAASAYANELFGQAGHQALIVQIGRFIVGDAATIVVFVPAAIAAMHWRRLRPTSEVRLPENTEVAALTCATVVLVALGYGAASTTPSPLLDLSFVSMAWLAIRYGMRGATIGVVAAGITATIVALFVHLAIPTLIQFEAFLIASAVMSWLLAGLAMERWDLLAALSRRAFSDELTGLPNRERLIEWLDKQRESAMVLVVLDVDEMRLLNEGVGRRAADRTLQDIALRLRAGLPSAYFVARVSADEYAVAVVDERSPHAIMSEVRQFFDAPFEVEDSRIFVSVSLGAVRMARAGDPSELLRKADMAVHRAKRTPSRAVVYSPDLPGTNEPLLVGQLHRAVESGELVPFFQPIFKYYAEERTWRVAGAEALLRWQHPQRGILEPQAFIDLLERLTISERVGWNVVETSLQHASQWRDRIPTFRVWVNLFERQTLDRSCARRITELLERTSMPANALVVEINERVVASDERDVAALALALRQRGVETAIDDFGTGGSSLGRIRDVPASILKIDRSFVNKSEVDTKAKAVASHVVRLAAELGLNVVAEGVENPMQISAMIEAGCEYAQGYALGHPLPANLFEREYLNLVPR